MFAPIVLHAIRPFQIRYILCFEYLPFPYHLAIDRVEVPGTYEIPVVVILNIKEETKGAHRLFAEPLTILFGCVRIPHFELPQTFGQTRGQPFDTMRQTARCSRFRI